MRINTNVDAMRAYSNYATWNASKSKSLLRISSGKRIIHLRMIQPGHVSQ
ncbi:hypothetical protein ACTQ44_01790 [Ligilactobacillus ruminis]